MISGSCSTTRTVLPKTLQALQYFDQPLLSLRVKSDARFVQDIQRPDQGGSKGGRQLNALRFASGKRGREAVQRNVVQSDPDQQIQPVADFRPESSRRWKPAERDRLEAGKKAGSLRNGHSRDFGDRLPADPDVPRFLAQPVSMAGEACGISAIPAEKDADVHLVFFLFQIFEKSQDAGESAAPLMIFSPDSSGSSFQGMSVGMPSCAANCSMRF